METLASSPAEPPLGAGPDDDCPGSGTLVSAVSDIVAIWNRGWKNEIGGLGKFLQRAMVLPSAQSYLQVNHRKTRALVLKGCSDERKGVLEA